MYLVPLVDKVWIWAPGIQESKEQKKPVYLQCLHFTEGDNNKNMLSSTIKCYDMKKTKEGYREKQRRG